MGLLFDRAEEVEAVENERARAVIYRVGRSLLVSQASGHPELAHIELLIRRSDELIARAGSIAVFHDWFAVSGYKAEVRVRMTPWAMRTRAQHRGIHIGTASRLVRMGVSTVHLFTQAPITAYTDIASLESALRAELRDESRR